MGARFGSREIANVVFKEIDTGKPVLYLETLETSSMEQTAEAVYARGGRGNPKRLMWESDKEIMYNMTDALISAESLSMLTGTELDEGKQYVHKKEVVRLPSDSYEVDLEREPVTGEDDYPMFVFKTTDGYDIGEEISEGSGDGEYALSGKTLTFGNDFDQGQDRFIVDYYYETESTNKRMTIKAQNFPGYYRLEAETLWRRESDGEDLPAIFTMPRVKIASDFNIENTSAGDPATFEFNVEAFPNADDEMVIIDVVEDDEE